MTYAEQDPLSRREGVQARLAHGKALLRRRRPALVGASVVSGLAAIAVVFSTVATAHAPAHGKRGFLGVNYPPFPSQVVPQDQDLHRMSRGGVTWVRWPFLWRMVQPDGSDFNWTIPDAVIARFASRGISVLPEVFGTATAVKKTETRPPLRPKSARSAWKRFLRASVERYGPGGDFWKAGTTTTARSSIYHNVCDCSAPPRPINAWQIWNEPNLRSYFKSRRPVHDYASLVRMSHKAIASVDPGAKIVLAGMPGHGYDRTAWGFLDRLYRAHHIKRQFDAVGLHPYSPQLPDLPRQIRKERRVMKVHHDAHTPLWITEIGWGSNRHPNLYELNKGLRGQKRLLKKSFRLITHKRHHWGIQRLLWFDWRDPARDVPSGCGFCSHAGLISHGGKPKPSWRAYKHFASP